LQLLFSKAKKDDYFGVARSAIQWNLVDIARSEIFTGEEQFHPKQLSKLLEISLIDNRPEFIKLLIESGVSLNNFLTVGRLYYLYNSKQVDIFKNF
jgi:hypothetical protein